MISRILIKYPVHYPGLGMSIAMYPAGHLENMRNVDSNHGQLR